MSARGKLKIPPEKLRKLAEKLAEKVSAEIAAQVAFYYSILFVVCAVVIVFIFAFCGYKLWKSRRAKKEKLKTMLQKKEK